MHGPSAFSLASAKPDHGKWGFKSHGLDLHEPNCMQVQAWAQGCWRNAFALAKNAQNPNFGCKGIGKVPFCPKKMPENPKAPVQGC